MNAWFKPVLCTALSAAVFAAYAAPENNDADRDANGSSFLIRNALVFDGARSLGQRDVLVRDGRIAGVERKMEAPAGVPVIDGSGKTLLPALIDAHTHSWGDAQSDALRFGVGTELDMMGDASRLPALKQHRQSMARTTQADLWSAGFAVTAPGGHGTQYGMKVPTLAAGDDANAFVAARVAEGSDYLKLIVEDMRLHGVAGGFPTISPAQVAASVRAAHRAQKMALVHVSVQKDGRQAIEAGADGLVHVFYDSVASNEFISAARRHKAFVAPTLSVVVTVAGAGEGAKLASDPRLQPQLSGAQLASLKATFPTPPHPEYLDRALQSVRKLREAGITILAGTDAGNPGTAHGASLHQELELLVRAGLTPVEALAAATSAPAQRFSLSDRGRIATGLRADLLLVKGDPTRDITATRAIDTVWKNGYAIDRELAASTQPIARAAVVPVETLVSDFDGGKIDTCFGSDWNATTDQMAGGASVVAHRLVGDGAAGSRGALEISGETKAGFAFPWSGVMFFPARQPMQPVDFSARKELVFQVRGDGRSYQAMLFSGPSVQGIPSTQSFVAGKEWREVRLPLSAFNGADLALLRGIAFTAGQPLGTFKFQIDQVEIR